MFIFAKPKSVSIAWPSSSKTILSGLRSLNIIEFLCKHSSARMISAIYILASSSFNLLLISKKWDKSPPGQYSSAKNNLDSV